MSKTRTLFIFGVLIAILPYMGFPYLWKNTFFTLLGLGLAFFAYTLHRESTKNRGAEQVFDNFSENSNFEEKAN